MPRRRPVAALALNDRSARVEARGMRILLIDHGCCDHPHTRVHRLREGLEAAGCTVAVCGPSTVYGFDEQPPGMHGIHLHDVAAASREFLAAVRDGRSEVFLDAVARVPSRLLGLARETARQRIAEAADDVFPEAIFVFHAGIRTALAVETGAPVVVHVTPADWAVAAARPSLQRLVSAAIGSSDRVIGADGPTAATLIDWLGNDDDARARCDTWPIDDSAAARIADACQRALARRRGDPA